MGESAGLVWRPYWQDRMTELCMCCYSRPEWPLQQPGYPGMKQNDATWLTDVSLSFSIWQRNTVMDGRDGRHIHSLIIGNIWCKDVWTHSLKNMCAFPCIPMKRIRMMKNTPDIPALSLCSRAIFLFLCVTLTTSLYLHCSQFHFIWKSTVVCSMHYNVVDDNG